jgi:protein kinase C substrate 80K-H
MHQLYSVMQLNRNIGLSDEEFANSIKKAYHPTKSANTAGANISWEFACLSTHMRIPAAAVNDDYCDCDDGSDEFLTSACPNGKFHCRTGHSIAHPNNNVIPSHMVGDGICDCCDGSDEMLGKRSPIGISIDQRLLSRYSKIPVVPCHNVC